MRGVSKTFDVRGQVVQAVQQTDLEVPDGQFACLVGPSGCGKTTLLRIIAGLETATTGSIDVRRSAIDRPLNSMIFQQESLFPWKTVWDNVEFALRMRGVERAERRRRTEEWLRKVGLHRFATRLPLSAVGRHEAAGQHRARVRPRSRDPADGRAVRGAGSADEAAAAGGAAAASGSDTRKTVMFVTHNIDEAVVLADRVIVMTAHPGRVKAEVAIDLARPRDPMDIRSDVRYMELTQEIWWLLRDEVLRARTQEEEGIT